MRLLALYCTSNEAPQFRIKAPARKLFDLFHNSAARQRFAAGQAQAHFNSKLGTLRTTLACPVAHAFAIAAIGDEDARIVDDAAQAYAPLIPRIWRKRWNSPPP